MIENSHTQPTGIIMAQNMSEVNDLPLKKALYLAKLGFHVFPLVRNSKLPAIKAWQDKATNDPVRVKQWFEGRYRQCNIGICTSRFAEDKKLVVIDVDNKHGKDGDQSLELLEMEVDLPATFVTTTANNGKHLFFVTNETYKNGINILGDGLDIRATGGYVVAPGTIIPEGAYRMTRRPLADLPQGISERLKAHTPKSNVIQLENFILDQKVNVNRAIDYLKNHAPHAVEDEGGDAITYAVCCTVMDYGISPATTEKLLSSHWNQFCIPPWSPEDLQQKIYNATKYRENAIGAKTGEADFSGDFALPAEEITRIENQENPLTANTPQEQPHGDLLSISDMLGRPKPIQIIKNILPEKGVAILAGESRHMKSFLILSLMLSSATNTPVHGHQPLQKRVLYAMNEGQAMFGYRAAAWIDHHDLEIKDVDGSFRIMETTPNLMKPDSIKSFIKMIRDNGFNPQVIVMDTFSKATVGGDDNSTKDMAMALHNAYALANAIDGLVILIDHFGKDAKKGIRGASAKFANADMVGLVTKTDNLITLFTDKMKDGEDQLKFVFDVIMTDARSGGSEEGDKMPVVVPKTLDTRPSYADWIKAFLQLEGAADKNVIMAEFNVVYELQDNSVFRAILARMKKRGVLTESTSGVISWNED